VLPLVRLDLVDHLSVKYSYPRWLVKAWNSRFGAQETRDLLAAGNRTPRLSARITSAAPSSAEVVAALEEEGFKIEDGPLERTLLFAGGGPGPSEAIEKGWVQFQDLTAIQIGAALAPPSGARVLDLCSAPGGKSAQLLEGLGDGGSLLAADRSESRLALVEANLGRIEGSWKTVVVPAEPEAIDLGESFTHILVDAPCSNTGVLGRRPEARWRVRREDLDSLAALQDGLLDAALRHLAPGGRLVYSTCSIEPQENEERVAALLRRNPSLVELETRLFLPHRVDADGGYYSLLRQQPSGGD
jgi:16S rRNA (cytosine967-C5)-methyltransferase